MKKIFRLASLTSLVAGSALLGSLTLLSTGCECIPGTDEDGKETTVCESLKKFEGTPFTEEAAYTAGNDIVIDGINGNIDVETGGSADMISVRVQPFSTRGHSREKQAKEDIENDLVITVEDGLVKVRRKDGAYPGLGADLKVTLPSGFNAAINIDVGNGFVDADLSGGTPTKTTVFNDGAGDVKVRGARGPLDIQGDFDVEVDVAEWSDQNGTIKSNGQLGDVMISVPSGAVGSIQATCDKTNCEVMVNGPGDWIVDEAAPDSKTINFSDVAGGGNVIVEGDEVSISG